MRLTRLSAAAIHLAVSVAIAAAVFTAIYFLWYPHELFQVAGGRRLFFIIALVNIIVGPVITFVVFVPGKKGLRFDLTVIAIRQVGALIYGLGVLFVSRPVYVVFVKDRYELMRANEYPQGELARAPSSPYAVFPLTGPQVVGARMPKDRAERERIMFLAPNGIDLQHMLQHYVPYDAVRPEVKAAAKPIAKLRSLNPGREKEVDELVRGLGRDEASIGFIPMRAGDSDLAVIVDRATGDDLMMVLLEPWDP